MAQIVQQTLQLGIYISLARLLSPREFGLLGMIIVLTGFANLFVELGFGTALVQNQNIQKRHLDSIFWLNTAGGLLLSSAFIVFSSTIATFYSEPVLRLPILLMSVNFLLNSLNIVQRNLMMKAMDFKRIFIVDTSAAALSGLTAIAAAASGMGLWSLVIQQILLALSSTVLCWGLSSWRPSLSFDPKALKDLSGFSANLLGFSIFDYLMNNVDKLLIGRFIGSGPLGIYTRAYQLMMLPVNQVSSVVTRVMFPALSVIQDDKEKVKQIYLRATRMIALVTFPAMVALLVLARPFVLAVLGEKWSGVVMILELFCLTGLGHSIGTTTGWIYYSQGRTDIMFKWGVFAGTVRLIAMILGLRWGIMGVAFSHVISTYVILTYPGWRLAGSLINMRFTEMTFNLLAPLLCAGAMGIFLALLGFSLPPDWPPWAYLAIQIPAGIAVYGVLVHLLKIKAYVDLKDFFLQEMRKRYKRASM